MKKMLWIVPVAALLAGCTMPQTQSDAQIMGTMGGAVVGAAVTPNDPIKGAIIGSVVGLAAGTYLGRDAAGQCVWQRPDGSRYNAACP